VATEVNPYSARHRWWLRRIAKLESRGSRGFREISDFELELASASL
jgi:hypothetical protein